MADEADTGITGKMKALINSVREKISGVTTSAATPSGRPLDRRLDGYRLYKQEQQALGEPTQSYDEWFSTQK